MLCPLTLLNFVGMVLHLGKDELTITYDSLEPKPLEIMLPPGNYRPWSATREGLQKCSQGYQVYYGLPPVLREGYSKEIWVMVREITKMLNNSMDKGMLKHESMWPRLMVDKVKCMIHASQDCPCWRLIELWKSRLSYQSATFTVQIPKTSIQKIRLIKIKENRRQSLHFETETLVYTCFLINELYGMRPIFYMTKEPPR